MPCFWQLQELVWDGGYLSGASVPGIPLMAIGRNKKVSWGVTAALNDISDLWQETISEDGSTYLVDGQQKEISYRTEIIKVKGQEDVNLQVGFTHRGPIISSTIIGGGAALFGGALPSLKSEKKFSFGWGFN